MPGYAFDDFTLDTGAYELRHRGERVDLEPQVFEVLAYLVEHHDRIVPKDELIEHVWPERYISDAALNSRIMSARKAIGDSGTAQRLIRTIHGRGYRFAGDVDASGGASVSADQARPPFRQAVQFCLAPDGVRLAWATSGSGPPLVKVANWLTHLEYDASSPVWSHIWRDLSSDHQLVRYDGRGTGLSDRDVPPLTFDDWVTDLEAVVEAAGLERFPLLGISQGGAVAAAYAARHPERVSGLVLLGAYSRGRLHRDDEWREHHEAMRTLLRQGWGREDNAFREVFTITMIPRGDETQRQWLTNLQRLSATAGVAVEFHDASGQINVDALLGQVRAPTLVLHARDDRRVPYEEGRRLASMIPGARFVSLESENHLLLEHEPAWRQCREELRAFLAGVEGVGG
jgi:pimeloyl-ACP methyl ester carboxylesterase/DNA-binding winged helix-turn-helix (wHTH) protein